VSRFVVGVGGASGAIYAHRLLLALQGSEHHVDVVISKMGRLVWNDEIGVPPESLGFKIYKPGDMTAPFASGSARYDGVVVVPCSAGGLARIAHGISADLIGRASDVALKERRPLILVVRETPYSLVALRNMTMATEAGATVMPASPSFYSNPADIPALVDTVTSRILDHLGVDNTLMPRWEGRTVGGTP